MVSRRRRTIPAKSNRRNSRRTTNLRRQLALIAHRLPAKSRLPRDPPAVVSGFDYTVKVPFDIVAQWGAGNDAKSFLVYLPGSPLSSGTVILRVRNNVDGKSDSRAYWLDYEEIFAAAYMRATGTNFSNASDTTKASLDFAMVSVKAWGPSMTDATMQLRCDGDTSVAGFAGIDKPGRNTRAAIGCTYPSIGWRKFVSIDTTTPAVLVNLNRINWYSGFAAVAAGTPFDQSSSLDFGQLQITVRLRYKLAVTSATSMHRHTHKGATVFDAEDDPLHP